MCVSNSFFHKVSYNFCYFSFPVPTTVNPTKFRSAESRAKLIKDFPIKCVFSTPPRLPKSPVKKLSTMLRPTAFKTNRLNEQTKIETVITTASEDVIVAKSPLFYCPVIKTEPTIHTDGYKNDNIDVTTTTKALNQFLDDELKLMSVTVVSSGQNLVLRTDQNLDTGIVSNVFVNSKDPPDELEHSGVQDVRTT